MSTNANVAFNECAACGKKASDLKTCTACKEVKYCNAACQKSHWPKHKDTCKKRAAELRDKSLFKQPPMEECPVCLLPLPDSEYTTYMPCCGKFLCNGCLYAVAGETRGFCKCPFCRTQNTTGVEDYAKQLKQRVEANDAEAFNQMALHYLEGSNGFPQDLGKHKELSMKAAKLGSKNACERLAVYHIKGTSGIEMDKKKAVPYWELAAMNGCLQSRKNLGVVEWNNGDKHKAMQHYIIGARAGHDECMGFVKAGYSQGLVDKHVFEEVLRAHKDINDEMKSDQREAAEAFRQANQF